MNSLISNPTQQIPEKLHDAFEDVLDPVDKRDRQVFSNQCQTLLNRDGRN